MSNRLLKFLSEAWDNFPFIIALVLAMGSLSVNDTDSAMHFVIYGLIFIVLKDIHEVKKLVKNHHCAVNVIINNGEETHE